ncbi:MAG TPA: glycerophosphodiester phosphodiesterase family protein [Candidatus Thermoplasmatota archaeon]|nr:glycerophosphodiester phosphodiesterase family protein [Candidatus Thermoplasmatota archaeon]
MPAFCAAHRGLSAELPENTLTAFQAAVIAGFPAIEMDLRVTSDGEVVVLHDAGIERTTSGNGRVADMRYDDLRSYPTPAGPVPRLDDLMRALREWKGLWDLELKTPAAAEPALHLIHHHRLEGRTLLSSFDPVALQSALEHAPEVPRGLIVLGSVDADEVKAAGETECRWLMAEADYLTAEVAEALHLKGFRLGAYTVNDADKAAAFVKWGVECIVTDTGEVLKAMAKKSERKPYF